jgi:hypothetical protein
MTSSRLAVAALAAVFLIPILQSNLDGLSHLDTCREGVRAPFEVVIVGDQPVMTGSTSLGAGEPTELCRGLQVEMSLGSSGGQVGLGVTVVNRSAADWRVTVEIDAEGVRFPIQVGRVASGSSVSRDVSLRLPDGTSRFDGAIVVGP